MDLFEALYTTRAMRRVRPDPVPLDVQARLMDAAVRAPTGGNQQTWRFVWSTTPGEGGARAALPRRCRPALETIYAGQVAAAEARPEDPDSRQFLAVQRSAQWLADHFEQVPLFLFPFAQHDPSGGSIYPRGVERHAGGPGGGHR